jgi:transcriptional regulator with XRE-family HTH domain
MSENTDHPLRDVLPLAEAFGRGLRDIRTANGLTLDKVASTATTFGLKWTTARVVEFERGKIPISLPTLMRLGTVLTALTGRSVTLVEMLGWDHWIELPGQDHSVIHADAFRQAFNGGAVDLRQGDEVERSKNDAVDASDLIPGVPPGTTVRQLKYMHEYAGLADVRAAKSLGLPFDEFLVFCQAMLHSTFGEVTMQLTSNHEFGRLKDAGPQSRGHLTRRLTRMLEKFIEMYRAGDERAVGVMRDQHKFWDSAGAEEKQRIQDLTYSIYAGIDRELPGPPIITRLMTHPNERIHFQADPTVRPSHSQWTSFGLDALDAEQLDRENWAYNREIPDDMLDWFYARMGTESQ